MKVELWQIVLVVVIFVAWYMIREADGGYCEESQVPACPSGKVDGGIVKVQRSPRTVREFCNDDEQQKALTWTAIGRPWWARPRFDRYIRKCE